MSLDFMQIEFMSGHQKYCCWSFVHTDMEVTADLGGSYSLYFQYNFKSEEIWDLQRNFGWKFEVDFVLYLEFISPVEWYHWGL